MILDLNLSSAINTTADVDVCIVGAGTAGIFLAHRLCNKHNIKNIALLEYGDNISRKPVEINQFCIPVDFIIRLKNHCPYLNGQ